MPEVVYFNGNLLTMDPRQPVAEALAVDGERLLAVGSNAAVTSYASPATRRVDLRGHFVLPGFHDAHLHLLALGRAMQTLDLRSTPSLAKLQVQLADFANGLAEAESWISGFGWDQSRWPEARLPNRHDLDAVSGRHPVYLERVDLHAALANSAALRAAGISSSTPNPPGGEIARDASGEPAGMLLEDARRQVSRLIPPPPPDERRRALGLALGAAATAGITSLQDYSGWEAFLDLEQLQQRDALPVRVREWLDFRQPVSTLLEQRRHHDPGDAWLATGMLKAFLDGSLGSRTAALHAPYSDAPETCGQLQYELAELKRMASERAEAGFQLGFHAIGDRAVSQALDVFEAAASGKHARAPRLEHIQVLDPADLPRLRRLGVIASVQPSHLLDDRRWARSRLGEKRLTASYPWQTFDRLGLPLAFGSDAPVAGLHPGLGLYAAVARPGADDALPFPLAGEAMPFPVALYAYTMGGAVAEGSEQAKGSLTPGKLADFVVLSHDLRRLAPDEYCQARALLTVVGGRAVYAAPEWRKQEEV